MSFVSLNDLLILFQVPVARAADDARSGTGLISLSADDPCLVLGHGTVFTSEFSPKMQIMLPKALNTAVAEVSEIVSDTELKIKREFGGESGKTTSRIREKVAELREQGINGLEFKTLPFVDQQEMYRHVYKSLKDGGFIGIFPEGASWLPQNLDQHANIDGYQVVVTIVPIFCLSRRASP